MSLFHLIKIFHLSFVSITNKTPNAHAEAVPQICPNFAFLTALINSLVRISGILHTLWAVRFYRTSNQSLFFFFFNFFSITIEMMSIIICNLFRSAKFFNKFNGTTTTRHGMSIQRIIYLKITSKKRRL